MLIQYESEGGPDKIFEVEITVIFFGKRGQLVRQPNDLCVRQAHLAKNFLHSLEFDVAWLFVLLTQQPEGVLDIDLVVLVITLEGKYLQEIVEAQLGLFGEHRLELLFLFFIGLEVHHLENFVELIVVELVILSLEGEYFSEVFLVHVRDLAFLCSFIHFSLINL